MNKLILISICILLIACSDESSDSDLVANSTTLTLGKIQTIELDEDNTKIVSLEVTTSQQFFCDQAVKIKNISNSDLFKVSSFVATGVNGDCSLSVTPNTDEYGQSEIELYIEVNGKKSDIIETSISVNPVTDISGISTAGYNNSEHTHTCKVTNNTTYCWGAGTVGQLGNGAWEDQREKVEVSDLKGVSKSVTTNYRNTCVLKTDKTLWCFGNGTYGQLGDGTINTKSTPSQVVKYSDGLALTDIEEVDHGYLGVCALDSSGQVWCWGYNSLGAVGDGTSVQKNGAVKVLRKDAGSTTELSDVINISTRGYHRCAVRVNGSVWCWGRGSFGTLGDNLSTTSNVAVEALKYNNGSPSGFTDAIKVSVGLYHSCVIDTESKVWCFGAGSFGKIGDGSLLNRTTARQVIKEDGSGLLASKVSLGFNHSCAISPEGLLYCWGSNLYGQLGIGTYSEAESKAKQVLAMDGTNFFDNITMVSAGFSTTCVVARDRMYCFGSNSRGALGSLSIDIDSVVPRKTTIDGTILKFTQGGKYQNPGFHCALMSDADKTMKCWGGNYAGQLGRGNLDGVSGISSVLNEDGSSQLKNITSASNSDYHACAISGGQVYCWGKNKNYQLGIGSYSVSESLPKKVLKFDSTAFNDAVSVSVGPFHSCAIDSSNQIWCWGSNSSGFLGNNTTVTSSRAVRVLKDNLAGGTTNFSDALKIKAGDRHTCAIDTSNQLWCWGLNSYGQLGDNSFVNKLTAVRSYKNDAGTVLFSNAKDISIGANTTCAIDALDKMWCFGSGVYYQTSQGTNSNLSVAEEIVLSDDTNPENLQKMSGGFFSGCASNSSNELFCGGRNLLGSTPYPSRVGNTEVKYTQIKDPLDTSQNWTDVKDFSIGTGSGCAVTNSAELYCWGLNSMGQGGEQDFTSSNIPVLVDN